MPTNLTRSPRRAAAPTYPTLDDAPTQAAQDDENDVTPGAPKQEGPQLGTTGGIVPQQAGTWDKKESPTVWADDPSERRQQAIAQVNARMKEHFESVDPFAPSAWQPKVPQDFYREGLRRADQEYRQQAVARRQQARADTNAYNSQQLAKFKGNGQQYYTDPATGRIVPVLEEGTGRALFHESDWEPSQHPKTGLPSFERRDKYGQRQFKRPALKDSLDPSDEYLYADMGDGESLPYMRKDEAAQSGDLSLAKLGRAALKTQRTARTQAQLQSMLAQDAVIDNEVADAQQQADAIQREIDNLSPKATNSGDTQINRDAYTSRIGQLENELQSYKDKLHAGSELMRRSRISKKQIGLVRQSAALEAYRAQQGEIEGRLRASGIPEQDFAKDPAYAQNMAGLRAAEAGVQAGQSSLDGEGVQARPAIVAQPQQPSDLEAGEPFALAQRGVRNIGGVSVQQLAKRYGDGRNVTPDSLLKLTRRSQEIADTLANENTRIDDKLRNSLTQEQQYLDALFKQRMARLPPEDQQRVQQAVRPTGVLDVVSGAIKSGAEAGATGGANALKGAQAIASTPIPANAAPGFVALPQNAPQRITAAQQLQDTRSGPLYRLGSFIEDAARDYYAKNPHEQDSTFSKGMNAVAEAAGGFAPLLASGPFAPATIGLQTVGAEMDENYQRAKDRGMSEEDASSFAINRAMANGALQATLFEALPASLRKAGNKVIVDKIAKGALSRFFANRLAQGAEGALLGAASQAAGNVVSGRPVGEGVPESAAGLAAMQAVTHRPGGQPPKEAPPKPREPIPEPEGPAIGTLTPEVAEAELQRRLDALSPEERAELDRIMQEEGVKEPPPPTREERQQQLEDAFGTVRGEMVNPKTAEGSADVFMREAGTPSAVSDMQREAANAQEARMRMAATDQVPEELAATQEAREQVSAEQAAASQAGATPEEARLRRIARNMAGAEGSDNIPTIDIDPQKAQAIQQARDNPETQWQYTVFRPGEGYPSAIQVDAIEGGRNTVSSNPADLRAFGIDMPEVPDWVPQGQYTLGELREMISRGPELEAPENTLPFDAEDARRQAEQARAAGNEERAREIERQLTEQDRLRQSPAGADALREQLSQQETQPNAIPEQSAGEGVLRPEQPEVELPRVGEGNAVTEEAPRAQEVRADEGAQEVTPRPTQELRRNNAGAELKPPAQMKRPELRAELQAAGVESIKGVPLEDANAAQLMAAVGRLRRGELTQELTVDKIAAKLRKAKIDTKGKLYDATGATAAHAWNTAIDLATLALRAGRPVEQAIRLAVARYRALHKEASEEDVSRLTSAITSATEPEPPKPAKKESKVTQSLKEAGAPVEPIDYDVRQQVERKREASQYIKDNGRQKAEAALDDRSIPGDTRVAIGGQLLNDRMLELQNARPEEATRLAKDIQRITAKMQPSLATEAGQQISMFSALYKDIRTATAMEYVRDVAKKRLERLGGEEVQNAADDAAKIIKDEKLTPEQKEKEIEKLKERYTSKPVRRVLNEWKRAETVQKLNKLGALTRDDMIEAAGNALGLPGIDQKKLKHLAEIADRIENAPNAKERTKAELELADMLSVYKGVNPLDLESSILTLNILSGPTTQLANLEGNALNAIAQIGTTAIANPTKVRPLVQGLIDGIRLGATEARSIMQTGRGTRDFQDKTSLAGSALQTVDYARDFPKLPKAAADVLTKRARVVEKIGRFMKAADAVFYYPAREAYARLVTTKLLESKFSGAELDSAVRKYLHITPEAFKSAENQAKAEGWDGIDLARRTSDIIEERRAQTPEGRQAVKESERFAAESTYNQEPEGLAGVVYRNAANLVNEFRLGTKRVNLQALKPWLMFLRVPANVFNATTNFTPMGAIRAETGIAGAKKGEWRNFTADERRRLYVQSAIGTALMGGLIYRILDKKDIDVTAGGPTNPTQRKQLQQGGWMPYSIKIGGKYYSYKDSPLLVPLSIVGNVADSVKYTKSKNEMLLENKVVDAIGQAPQTIFQTSMLSGLADLMASLSAKGNAANNVGRSLASVPANLTIPYNRLLQQIDQVFHPEQHDVNPVLGAVPFARRMGPQRTDVQGRPEVYNPFGRFGSSESNDPLDALVREKQVFIPDVDRDVKLGDKVMTDGQRTAYRQLSGNRIRARLLPLAPRLRMLSKEKAQDQINAIVQQERIKAKEMIRRMPTADK